MSRWLCLALALVGPVSLSGCKEDPAVVEPPPTLEELATEKYERLVKEVRRRLADTRRDPIPLVGGPLIDWSTEVTDELIPPEAEGLAWRGKLTAVTRSSVTVITTPSEDEEEKPNERRRNSDLEEPGGEGFSETGNADLDAVLGEFASADRSSAQRSRSPMRVIDDDKTEVFDLIFEDGRWRLTTPVDGETQMELIMQIAVRSQ